MAKQSLKDAEAEVLDKPIFDNTPADAYPEPLITKLAEFYVKHPNYPTGLSDIWMLCNILQKELNKFVLRPHKKITEIVYNKSSRLDPDYMPSGPMTIE